MAGCPLADVFSTAALAWGHPGLARVAADLNAPLPASAAAPVRYRRILAAWPSLTAMAAEPGGERLAGLLASDEVVLARMDVAAEVLRQAGMPVPLPLPAQRLRAAIGWQRYARGPVSELHASCAADLARGALRLAAAATGTPPPAASHPGSPPVVRTQRLRLQQTRLQAAGAVRSACVALRAELQTAAAGLTRADDFVRYARRKIALAAAEIDAELTVELGVGCREPIRLPDGAAPRGTGLERRLSALVALAFGTGVALTLGRALGDLLPGSAPALAAGCGALGLASGVWMVRARRLLSERAAADRWAVEITAGLRSTLEERVFTRVLAAEVALLTSGPFGGPPPV